MSAMWISFHYQAKLKTQGCVNLLINLSATELCRLNGVILTVTIYIYNCVIQVISN